MDMSRDQAVSLVNQVQRSHRLLAGFYKRILPALDDLASSFGASFWYWGPISFDRPCKSSTKPSSKWAWDFLPLIATQFVYIRSDDGNQAAIELQLRTDPSVLPELRLYKGQPNPTNLPDATPVLRIYLYWLKANSSADIKSEWEQAEHPAGEADSISTLTDDMEGTWLEVPLANFILAPQDAVSLISKFIVLPASSA
ncbi:hypothetical protein C4J87_0313 [Pseudomonas sp. R1-43-08]|jgi:hypothetical protein|uniref:hypothetical protein n=1 Tax=Pseudomonas sp. R1-43-08 TaxID=1173270 RepID=UPI000F579FA0|nr:hypothetical protein [Pseudomonas sp. R1-43-08]AZF40504.1 hypothetical protein C4J87_0313 [Pseudomonas sp. R1-43-08]